MREESLIFSDVSAIYLALAADREAYTRTYTRAGVPLRSFIIRNVHRVS